MKVMITGAEGFVASYLADVMPRGSELLGTYFLNTKREYRTEFLDIRDPGAVDSIIGDFKPDLIYHLAAQASGGVSIREPYLTYTVNFSGTLNILESVRKNHRDCRIIIPSSSDVYGDPAYLPMDENHPLSASNPYSSSKSILENAIAQYTQHYGIDVVLTRSFNHTGRGQDARFFIPSMIRQISETKDGGTVRTGNLDVKRDFLDVRDVVKAYRMLIDADAGVYNVCSGKAFSLREVLEFIIELSGKDITVLKDPERVRKHDPEEIRGTYSKLHKATGWEPATDIMKTIEWMCNE